MLSYLLPSSSLSLSLSQSLQHSLIEQRCGTEDVDTFPSKIDNDRRDCEAANKQSGKCRQKLTTTTEEEKEEEEQRAKFVANFSFDLNYDKHAKCCRVAHPTNPRPAQRILYGNVRKKKETNLINSSLELRASRTCNNFHLATFFFNIIYIFILFFRKIIWRWRRRSDLLCLGYVWAAPWTGCCHAASSHLDVVRAALRKSLSPSRSPSPTQSSLSLRSRPCLPPTSASSFRFALLPVRVVLVLCTLVLYIVYL